MKKEFPGYFANGTADIEVLWDNCLFVLDANVLLSLYRYSDSTRSDLLQVFESLVERLWVPNQVAYEYLSNRLNVIGEQVKIYDDAVKKTDALKKSLESVNQHPFVSAPTLLECNLTFDKLLAELGQNRKIHERRIGSDEIKDQLESLLEGRVGSEYSREKIEEVISEGRLRYEEKIPPGFNDMKKGGDSSLLSERRKPYGDYIVWLQIIEKAVEIKKPVVFVTGDIKDDWWVSFSGKTVGPLPQLIQEFFSITGHSFYMYPPEKFLERASTYLKQETSETAINEIREVREEEAESFSIGQTGTRWFKSSFPREESFRSWWESTNEKRVATMEESNRYLIADLPWNISSTKQEHIIEERNAMMELGLSLRGRLEEARIHQVTLQAVVKRLSSHASHALREEASVVHNEMDLNNRLINELEEELMCVREKMAQLISKLKYTSGDSVNE